MAKQGKKPVSFLSALASILSAAIGVQKRDNMARDLNASNPKIYVMAGVLFFVLFVGTLATVVAIVTP